MLSGWLMPNNEATRRRRDCSWCRSQGSGQHVLARSFCLGHFTECADDDHPSQAWGLGDVLSLNIGEHWQTKMLIRQEA